MFERISTLPKWYCSPSSIDEGDDEALGVRIVFPGRGDDADVDEAVFEIVAPQEVAIDLDAVGIVDVVRLEEAQPVRLAGLDDVLETLVGEGFVADEHDLGDAGLRALVDLEDEVDATVRQFDDLGRHGHVVAARALVDLDDALHVRLHERAREGAARLRLDFLGKLLVLGFLVAFERDAIDDGILDHRHQNPIGPGRDPHVLEQAGGVEPLEGGVDLGCIQPLAGSDAEIRANRIRLDTAVTFDIDAQRLRDGDIRGHDRPHDRTEDQHAEQGSCDPNPPQHLHAHSPK